MRLSVPFFVLLASAATVGITSLCTQSPQETAPESSRTYVNHQFGFSLDIPFALPACDPLQNNQDTGITVFLDGGWANCPGEHDRRFMAYHESYNAADYWGPRAMLESWCKGKVTPTDPLLFPVAVSAMPMMCRESYPDGYDHFTLAGLAREDSVEVTAYFQTRTDTFGADLEAFEAMLRSMRRYEPDPTDARGSGWSAILSREMKKQ